jgi:hypothetical protein
MQDIEKGLKMLNVGLRRLAREVGSLRVSGNGRPERKRPVTRALRLQGRYMGLIRTLPPRLKAKVTGIRARRSARRAPSSPDGGPAPGRPHPRAGFPRA